MFVLSTRYEKSEGKNVFAHSVSRAALHAAGATVLFWPLQENAALFELSLCLSQARLGKMIVFIWLGPLRIKLRKKTRFLTCSNRQWG
eukprot:COSAG06_NODE_1259_length_10075_cov_50.687049_4_plen_88_part_00